MKGLMVPLVMDATETVNKIKYINNKIIENQCRQQVLFAVNPENLSFIKPNKGFEKSIAIKIRNTVSRFRVKNCK